MLSHPEDLTGKQPPRAQLPRGPGQPLVCVPEGTVQPTEPRTSLHRHLGQREAPAATYLLCPRLSPAAPGPSCAASRECQVPTEVLAEASPEPKTFPGRSANSTSPLSPAGADRPGGLREGGRSTQHASVIPTREAQSRARGADSDPQCQRAGRPRPPCGVSAPPVRPGNPGKQDVAVPGSVTRRGRQGRSVSCACTVSRPSVGRSAHKTELGEIIRSHFAFSCSGSLPAAPCLLPEVRKPPTGKALPLQETEVRIPLVNFLSIFK